MITTKQCYVIKTEGNGRNIYCEKLYALRNSILSVKLPLSWLCVLMVVRSWS